MYYYGNNGYYGGGYGGYQPCCNTGYAGYTSGYGIGAAIWIVLFILLVIIIGAGWSWSNNNQEDFLPFFILQMSKFMVKYSHLRGGFYEVTEYHYFR